MLPTKTTGAADAKFEKIKAKSKAKSPKSKSKFRDRDNVYAQRARTLRETDVGPRLLAKPEVIALTGTSYPTLWAWMRAGTFPRALIVGGRSMWRSEDIDAWIANLKVRPLKGDTPSDSEAA
jgi:predicted DNA-binding transcriptional regulator AlpA